MNVRDQLLEAAARVYAEAGYRGATTRRIAREAGVNEITLFRQFGSKETLLHEAIARAGAEVESAGLPDEPRDPERELTAWARGYLAHLADRRALIRTCMGEMREHPDVISSIDRPPSRAASALARYLRRLRQRKIATAVFDERVAAAMLMGTLFGDAMGRDILPEMFARGVEASLREYVRLFLRAVGASSSGRADGS
ncbi:MAG TPA: helix-turn-helix domain-containing protein [Gemmatimonadales bacterium]|nr:helix-turn-helix domain-containing protein [Gemmatimonadales bacterium]